MDRGRSLEIVRYCLAVMLLQLPAGCMIFSPKDTSQKSFESHFKDFRYCAVAVTSQSKQRSCGAAALTAVLNYWKDDIAPEFSEKQIVKDHPPRSEEGYPILQMREIAVSKGFAAFAVTLDKDPWEQLGKFVDRGQPVICAVLLPRGRYYGKNIPLVETLDRRTLMSTGNESLSHYVVVIGRNYKEVLLMDPKSGYVRVQRDAFLNFWRLENYAALVCSSK